jgi:hypothetical protein
VDHPLVAVEVVNYWLMDSRVRKPHLQVKDIQLEILDVSTVVALYMNPEDVERHYVVALEQVQYLQEVISAVMPGCGYFLQDDHGPRHLQGETIDTGAAVLLGSLLVILQ